MIFLCAQHVNYKHVLINWTSTHVSLLLTSLLTAPSSSKCRMSLDSFAVCFFMGCNHVTAALLILMSADIFPASCLHFRTSLWSITANRWVHLQYSRYTVWNLCRSLWIQSDFIYVIRHVLWNFLLNVCPTEYTTCQTVDSLFVCDVCMYSWMWRPPCDWIFSSFGIVGHVSSPLLCVCEWM